VPQANDNQQEADKIVYYVPGFHCDAVWLEDQRDYAVSLLGDVRQNLAICRFDPDYGVYLHEISYLKPYFDTYVWDRDLIRDLIWQGRVGTGGSYNQPTEKLISGEGIIRNIIYGRLFHEGVLGDDPQVYTPWDVFGHCAQLSQILRKSRFIGCLWSKYIHGFPPIFRHQSLDGSTLLFRRMHYGFGCASLEELRQRTQDAFKEIASLGLSADMRVHAEDFQPPPAMMAGQGPWLKSQTPRIVVTGDGHREYFQNALTEISTKGIRIPVTARDMEYYHQGTALTRLEFKIGNRLGENALISAEKFGTVAAHLGARYPERALDKAWRQLLFNQHHDAITGPLCDRAFLDVVAGYREAVQLATDALRNSLNYLGRFVDTASAAPAGSAIPIAVFNPLNWTRTDVCEVEVQIPAGWKGFGLATADGRVVKCELTASLDARSRRARLRFLADEVPSIGYRVFYVVPAAGLPATPQPKNGNSISNGIFRIEVDPEQGGGIVSLRDLKAKRELLDASRGPGNELVALEEKPDSRASPWEVWTTGPKVFSREFPAEAHVESGPVSTRLVITGPAKACRKRQEIVLYNGLRRIDFLTRLEDYEGENHLWVVTFPSALEGAQPVFEERFGAVVRKASKDYLDFRTDGGRNFADAGIRSAYQWMDHNYSALLQMGDAKDRDYAEVALGMVALVVPHSEAALDAAEALQTRLITKGIVCTPLFDDLDRKRRAALPREDATLPVELNEDLTWGTSFRIILDVGGRNLYLRKLLRKIPKARQAALERQVKTDGYGFLFVFDEDLPQGWAPLPVLIVSADDDSHLAMAVDRLTEGFAESAVMRLPAEANATGKALKVDRYGLAILNLGNILYSVENDNSLVLFLMHTPRWGTDRLPYRFVPERKTHQFLYALYPHEGDWRQAATYRAGYEFNNPLLPVVLAQHHGPLPACQSFLTVEGESLVVTAMKAAGHPCGGFEGDEGPNRRNEWIVRAYEATGAPAEAVFTAFRPVVNAEATNLLEESEASVAFDRCSVVRSFAPFGIETTLLEVDPWAQPGKEESLGAQVEVAQPVHARFWQHNMGEAPLGNTPVAISVHGEILTGIHIRQGGVTINTFKVCVANDYLDTGVSGTVKIIVPEGWETIPAEFEYNLDPGEHHIEEVLLKFLTQKRRGVIKVRLEHDGQVFQDVLEVGLPERLRLSVREDRGGIEAVVHNPTEDEAEGVVSLIVPVELWSPAEVGRYSLGNVTDWVQQVRLAPGETKAYRFPLRAEKGPGRKSYWAIAKLAHNGFVDYQPLPGHTIEG
jgi:alpha-mannosidase